VFFVDNLDRTLLSSHPRDDHSLLISADGSAGWFAEATCDEAGLARATAPEHAVSAVAVAEGRFMVAGQISYGANVKGQFPRTDNKTITMDEVRVGIVAISDGHIVGRTIGEYRGRWGHANSTYAIMAAMAARDMVIREYPNATVMVDSLVTASVGHRSGSHWATSSNDDQDPEVHFVALTDGGAFERVTCRMRLYSKRQLDPPGGTAAWATDQTPGRLLIDEVAGFPATVEAPLVCFIDSPNQQQISVSMCYGREYRLPAGKHAVFLKQLGMRARTPLADVIITAHGNTRLKVQQELVRWPVTLCVSYPDGSAPAFCQIEVKDVLAGLDVVGSAFSPLDPGHYQVFLKPGPYDITVTRGMRAPRVTHRVIVGTLGSRVMLPIPW
jgi:hypothetical protein